MAKMDAYAHRSDKLKAFLSRSRSPSSDGGSLGPADSEAAETTGASSDSGVETYDDGTHNSHNLSADSADAAGERRGETGRDGAETQRGRHRYRLQTIVTWRDNVTVWTVECMYTGVVGHVVGKREVMAPFHGLFWCRRPVLGALLSVFSCG